MEGDGTRMWTRDENDIAMHTEGRVIPPPIAHIDVAPSVRICRSACLS